ncbi:MAG: hypothetical protein ACLQFR_19135 [Streptosporangiaceae bacterium]
MTTARVLRSTVAGLITLFVALTAAVVPAAQASQAPSGAWPAAASYKYTLSRIAYTGSRIVIAATDSHGDLYFFWKQEGTSTWHKQLVAKGGHGKSVSKPSIAWTGHAVLIVALDAAGDLISYTQHSGSSAWKYQRVARASGGHFKAPSLAVAANGAVLIGTGTAAGLVSFARAPGGSSWTRLSVASGTFGAPTIITCYDSIVSAYLGLIVATSSNNSLDFWWERLDVPGWHQETIAAAGPGGSYYGGSLAATSSHLLVAATTTTGAVDEWSQPIGGSGWSQQTVAWSAGTTYSHAQIAWTGPVEGGSTSFDVITATTQSGRLAYWWTGDGGTIWTAETVAAASKNVAYANPSIRVSDTSVIITAINTKPGNVLYWNQAFGTTPWHKQLVAKG